MPRPAASPPTRPSDNDVDRLADEAMKAASAGEVRDDLTFGDYAYLFGFFRSAVIQEGWLVEMAIEQAVLSNPDLKLLPAKAMPIVPTAQEMLKRTPSDEIKGGRFPSRAHATETYKPDLFVMNRTSHSGLILDVKRSLGSYRPQAVDRLRFRMLAVAAIAPEWVAEHQGLCWSGSRPRSSTAPTKSPIPSVASSACPRSTSFSNAKVRQTPYGRCGKPSPDGSRVSFNADAGCLRGISSIRQGFRMPRIPVLTAMHRRPTSGLLSFHCRRLRRSSRASDTPGDRG